MEIATVAEDGGGKAQFLFEDTDFEDPNFHAAAFVAKYRRVTSLESLRDQLRQYCSFLKDEVFFVHFNIHNYNHIFAVVQHY